MRKNISAVNYLAALLIILSLNFILPRLMPGNPVQAIYGTEAMIAMTPELEAELIQRFKLDQSLVQQFFAYAKSLCQADLGYSYYYNAPVIQVIFGSLPWTLLLAGLTLFFSNLMGIALGIESGFRRGRRLDNFLLGGLMFLSGFPDFFMGILLLLLFGVVLGLAPLSGAITPYAGMSGAALWIDIFHHLALPVAALVLVRITSVYLLTRNTMIITMGEGFIRTARAKGCPETVIRYRHAGRNSLLPAVTAVGIQMSHMLSGVLFIEIVFSYPGVGLLLYNSLLTRDYPLLQGILMVLTIGVLTINLLVDLIYQKLDPRVAYAR